MKTRKILLGLAVLGLTTVFASDGAKIYTACAACHGVNGEKVALGKSKIIKSWDSKKTIAALEGYKKGTYGGAMKGVMKGQVARLSSEDIKAVAKHIETLK